MARGKGAVWGDDARRSADEGVAVGKRAVGMVAVGKRRWGEVGVWRGKNNI